MSLLLIAISKVIGEGDMVKEQMGRFATMLHMRNNSSNSKV